MADSGDVRTRPFRLSTRLAFAAGCASLVCAFGLLVVAFVLRTASSSMARTARADTALAQIQRTQRLVQESGPARRQQTVVAELAELERLFGSGSAAGKRVRSLEAEAHQSWNPAVRHTLAAGLAGLRSEEQQASTSGAADGQRWNGVAVGLALLLAVGLTAWPLVLLRRLRRDVEVPLHDLRDALDSIGNARGIMSVRPSGAEEIAELGAAFNSMAERLAQKRVGLESAAARLKKAAERDAVTGIWNRAYFEEELARQFEHSCRTRTPLSVLLLDLDGFKDVNDTFGHSAGDSLLRRTAMALERSVRETDTVGRLGGDEFAVILPGADEAAAGRVSAAVTAMLAATEIIAGSASIVPMASIGAATRTARTADPHELLRGADAAMYAAKQARRRGRRPQTVRIG